MGKMSREKGKRGERLLASFLRDEGFDARRGVQYAGGPDSPDVVGLAGIHIECKFVERLNIYDALAQSIGDSKAGEKPTVFHKRSNGDWLVTMRAKDFLDIYRDYDPERSGLFECMHCMNRSAVWQSDFSFEDYGMEGEGIVHHLHCDNCGADIDYFVPVEVDNEID